MVGIRSSSQHILRFNPLSGREALTYIKIRLLWITRCFGRIESMFSNYSSALKIYILLFSPSTLEKQKHIGCGEKSMITEARWKLGFVCGSGCAVTCFWVCEMGLWFLFRELCTRAAGRTRRKLLAARLHPEVPEPPPLLHSPLFYV